MNVRFIDTSIMLNLLEVPNKCENYEEVMEQMRECLAAKDTLIMPFATIIETGNHIAHIKDGNIRRKIAGKFSEYLRKTAEGEAPWQLYEAAHGKAELLYIAEHTEDIVLMQMGTGDMSIVYDYDQYKKNMPAIGRIMIWSTDSHLQGYCEENVSMTRRRSR